MVEWGSIADWASAAGSVLASGVALYLARSAQRVSMQAICGRRIMVGGNQQVDLASILVTNTGGRPFKISSISIRHGLLKRNYGIIKLGQATEYCAQLLTPLNDGDSSHFGVEIDSDANWVGHMVRDCNTWIDVQTIRITIHCTNGQRRTIKPEKPLLQHIYNQVAERKKHMER